MKNLIPIEYAAQRVLTTKQLATFYECDMQKIHQHLRRDKDRFVEGEYYFKLRHKNLREFKKSLSKELYFKYESVPALYLWTKSGCALHAEILDTDKVRKAFEELEKNYFNVSASLMENRRNNASQIVVASNVRCYLDENGTAWLNVEDVARGLGFVDVHQKKDFATSGEKYETVRWSRVNQYLQEFGYSKIVDKDDFIPENMFYRLAMKAKNEVAEKFQAKVADEVLPSIRKTGKEDTASESAEETSLQIFNNAEFGEIRTAGTPDNPLFCLADVCRALEFPQVAKVVQRLDREVLSTHPLKTSGGVQNLYFVNESGLYDVILDSRKPEAKKFRKWITSEVLPSIRKTGKYELNPASEKLPLDKKIDLLKFLVEQSPNAEIKIKYLERIAELI